MYLSFARTPSSFLSFSPESISSAFTMFLSIYERCAPVEGSTARLKANTKSWAVTDKSKFSGIFPSSCFFAFEVRCHTASSLREKVYVSPSGETVIFFATPFTVFPFSSFLKSPSKQFLTTIDAVASDTI